MSLAALIAKHKDQPVTSVTPKENTRVTPAALGGQECNPCNPCNPEKHRGAENKPARAVDELQNSEALLIDLARTLQADVHRLRALLSDDDMQDIAEGQISRGHLLAYFRLMRSDGKPLADDTPVPGKTPENGPSHVERMKAWKPAHEPMINHVMACTACYAPRGRYCSKGADLRRQYMDVCQNSASQRPYA